MNYVARCPGCKRLVGAVSEAVSAKDRTKLIARWNRASLIVRSMETAEVKAAEWECRCKPAKAKQEAMFQ